MKPRVRFCWLCSKKLYGNHFKEIPVDGHVRTLHKACATDVIEDYDIKLVDGMYLSYQWNYKED